jgi:hypothetical protein
LRAFQRAHNDSHGNTNWGTLGSPDNCTYGDPLCSSYEGPYHTYRCPDGSTYCIAYSIADDKSNRRTN